MTEQRERDRALRQLKHDREMHGKPQPLPLSLRVRDARRRTWFCSHCDASNLPSFQNCYGCDRPRFEK